MNDDSIQNKMAKFEPTMCPLEQALDAKSIIEQYDVEYMKVVSPIGTAFYVWVSRFYGLQHKKMRCIKI